MQLATAATPQASQSALAQASPSAPSRTPRPRVGGTNGAIYASPG
jgi:hypothetical protein